MSESLTQERLKELFDYDPITGIFTRKKRPNKSNVGTKSLGYIRIYVDGKLYLSHRLAWLYVYGCWPSRNLDHINRTRCDNRISNLRLATPSENSQNKSIPKNNKSGIPGVRWDRKSEKWESYLRVNGKKLHLGYYDDKGKAELARIYAVKKHHPFAVAG